MAIDNDDLRKLTAEYENWIGTKEYKDLGLPSADSDEGKTKHREAFLQHLSEAGISYPTFDPKKDETDNITKLNEVINSKSNPGILDNVMGFLGDNKFALGAGVLAVIASLATGMGGLLTAVITGAAFVGGSLIGDEEGLLSAVTDSHKTQAPTKVRFLEGDAANLPIMENLQTIGEVKHFTEHTSFRTLAPADNKPSQETNISTTLHIDGHDIVAYGTRVGREVHLTHMSLGTSKDGQTIIQPIPEGTGNIKLEIVGDKIELHEESAKAVAKAYDNLVGTAQGKPQISDEIIPVAEIGKTRELKAGERVILKVTNDEGKVIGMVQGNVIKTDKGELRFKAIAANGYTSEKSEEIDESQKLVALRSYREIPLDENGKLDTVKLAVELRDQRSHESVVKVIDPEHMKLQLEVSTLEEKDKHVTITGKYHNDVTRSVDLAGVRIKDPSDWITTPTTDKAYKIEGDIVGEGEERKLVITKNSKITLDGVELDVGKKDIEIKLGDMDLSKPESQAAIAEKLKANVRIEQLMQIYNDPETGRSLAGLGAPSNFRGGAVKPGLSTEAMDPNLLTNSVNGLA